MKLSARNQIAGTVTEIKHGQVMATVKVTLGGGDHVTSVVTKEAVEELGLAEGSSVTVLIKATEVMLATD